MRCGLLFYVHCLLLVVCGGVFVVCCVLHVFSGCCELLVDCLFVVVFWAFGACWCLVVLE